jgi:hypothetical protein
MEPEIIKLIKALGYHNILLNRGLIQINYKGDITVTSKGRSLISEDSSWISEWIALWPTNLSRIIGYSVSGNTEACKIRMNKFISSFPEYNKEIIMKATNKYLKEQELKGWAFTKKNVKFISDREGSMLEAYCKDIINNVKGGFYEDALNFL